MSSNIVVNLLGLNPETVSTFLLDSTTHVSTHEMNGVEVAYIWECQDSDTVPLQLEVLWGNSIGAKVCPDSAEQESFVKYLMLIAS